MSAGGVWQLRAALVLGVLVLLLMAVVVGGYVEHSRAGGTRDLGQQLDAVVDQVNDALTDLAAARAAADGFARRADMAHAQLAALRCEVWSLRAVLDDRDAALQAAADGVDQALAAVRPPLAAGLVVVRPPP